MVEGHVSDYGSHKVTCLKVRYAEVLTCNIFMTQVHLFCSAKKYFRFVHFCFIFIALLTLNWEK